MRTSWATTGWSACSRSLGLVQFLARPVVARRVNGFLALFWVAMIPVSILTGWISSVTYVAALSHQSTAAVCKSIMPRMGLSRSVLAKTRFPV